MSRSDANNPTIKEYIDSVLENELAHAQQLKNEKKTLSVDYYIKFLTELRRNCATIDFAQNIGLSKGSKRKTDQNECFKEFRGRYPRSRDYEQYLQVCKETNRNPYTPDAFEERLKREKKKGV